MRIIVSYCYALFCMKISNLDLSVTFFEKKVTKKALISFAAIPIKSVLTFVGTGVLDGPIQKQSNFCSKMLDFVCV